MGKQKGSWIQMVKKAIHEHIHGDIDEDILRFPHLPHQKKSQYDVTTTRDPPVASSGSQKAACTCSCGHTCVSRTMQVSTVDGRSASIGSTGSSSAGTSSRFSLSDCRNGTGSCSMNCTCSSSSSKGIHSLGDRRPPTEEPMLHYEDESAEVDDRETIVTLVNLWGPH